MKASDNLLLIESRNKGLIYEIDSTTKAITGSSAGRTIWKNERYFGSYTLYREITLFQDYTIYNHGPALEVTQYNISNIFPNAAFTLGTISKALTSLGQILRLRVDA